MGAGLAQNSPDDSLNEFSFCFRVGLTIILETPCELQFELRIGIASRRIASQAIAKAKAFSPELAFEGNEMQVVSAVERARLAEGGQPLAIAIA
jgi:hypothetical protein